VGELVPSWDDICLGCGADQDEEFAGRNWEALVIQMKTENFRHTDGGVDSVWPPIYLNKTSLSLEFQIRQACPSNLLKTPLF
jgi:hypothetical protein